VPVATFWNRLARYGLQFDAEERGYVLERLRSMGVYERYSDAGEAAYVRNLMTTTRAA
jgi:DNA phosphorothioation-dependent restriction protein DptG